MRAMFVCSTGGHLTELLHWSTRLQPAPTSAVWVTHDRANAHEIRVQHPAAEVHYVRPVEPKQAGAAGAVLPHAVALLRSTRPDVVVSTGAAVAVPFAAAARITGHRFHYIESAARVVAPSLSGRMVHRLFPDTSWSQTRQWPSWRQAGSLYDGFAIADNPSDRAVSRVVVALGTQANFSFRAAVETVVAALKNLEGPLQVLWQVGSTDVTGLAVERPRRHVPGPELLSAMRHADVVITHAGVGLSLLSLQSSHIPVLLPRRLARSEHTDDHQVELAAYLQSRELAVAAEVGVLSPDDLETSRRRKTYTIDTRELPRLSLDASP